MRARTPAAVDTFPRNVSTAAVTGTASAELFKDRYRTDSPRLQGWDYAGDGWYFVTICTWGRSRAFGEIVDGQMELSRAGQIADEEWRQTAVARPYVTIDEYVVMPHHVHGILSISGRHPSVRSADVVDTSQRDVSTTSRTRLIAGSLGAIIGQFKGACTKRIRETCNPEFRWQARFYDHIIRDDDSLDHIRQYIADNPLKWELEQDVPENVWM